MSRSSELLQYISKLNYVERRKYILRDQRARIEKEKAEKKKPTRFLYKYMGIDTPLKKTRTQSVIADSKLWFASPSSFNDPFDMRWQTVIEGTPQKKRARLLKLIKQNPDIATGSKAHKESEASRILAAPDSLVEQANIAGLSVANKAGVLSLSSEPRSILMWSHYAVNHTGLALQFEIARHSTFFVPAVTVKYSRDYPIRNLVDDSHQSLEMGLYGKYEDWAYEEERRVIHADLANTQIGLRFFLVVFMVDFFMFYHLFLPPIRNQW